MHDQPIGIGPVLTGTDPQGKPAYLYELLWSSGRIERHTWPKQPGKADRRAKMQATLHRLDTTQTLRKTGGVTVTWDAPSFDYLVRLVIGPQVMPAAA